MIIHPVCMTITSYYTTGIKSPVVLFGAMELLYQLWVVYKYVSLCRNRNNDQDQPPGNDEDPCHDDHQDPTAPPNDRDLPDNQPGFSSPTQSTKSSPDGEVVTGKTNLPTDYLSYLTKAAVVIACCCVVSRLLVDLIGIMTLFYEQENYFSYLISVISVCVIIIVALLTGVIRSDCNKQVFPDTPKYKQH